MVLVTFIFIVASFFTSAISEAKNSDCDVPFERHAVHSNVCVAPLPKNKCDWISGSKWKKDLCFVPSGHIANISSKFFCAFDFHHCHQRPGYCCMNLTKFECNKYYYVEYNETTNTCMAAVAKISKRTAEHVNCPEHFEYNVTLGQCVAALNVTDPKHQISTEDCNKVRGHQNGTQCISDPKQKPQDQPECTANSTNSECFPPDFDFFTTTQPRTTETVTTLSPDGSSMETPTPPSESTDSSYSSSTISTLETTLMTTSVPGVNTTTSTRPTPPGRNGNKYNVTIPSTETTRFTTITPPPTNESTTTSPTTTLPPSTTPATPILHTCPIGFMITRHNCIGVWTPDCEKKYNGTKIDEACVIDFDDKGNLVELNPNVNSCNKTNKVPKNATTFTSTTLSTTTTTTVSPTTTTTTRRPTTTTTTRRPTTTTRRFPSNCHDANAQCQRQRHRCMELDSIAYMVKNCQRSCDYCGCVDNSHNCGQLRAQGRCTQATQLAYMGFNCRKTCGWC